MVSKNFNLLYIFNFGWLSKIKNVKQIKILRVVVYLCQTFSLRHLKYIKRGTSDYMPRCLQTDLDGEHIYIYTYLDGEANK